MNGFIWSWCIELNKNVSCSAIGVVLYYRISIHEIVIKFHMSNDSFKYYYRIVYVYINIRYFTVFSDKLVMATCHAILINLHLFELHKSLKTCIAWPVAMVAMASFTTDSIIIILLYILHIPKQEVTSIEGIHIKPLVAQALCGYLFIF
jgi:hypothetical protein